MINKEFLKTLTILYVEDDLTIQNSLSAIFIKVFKEVIVCDNGEDAFNEFQKHTTIDAVVSDINMPKMNGIEMARLIRENDPNIPILFTTAHGESHYLMDAIKLKISHYALKPINTTELLTTISELCLSEHNKQLLNKKSQEISEYTGIIDQLAAIFETSEDGKINFANDLALEVSQFSLDELKGLEIQKLFATDNLTTNFQSLKEELLQNGSLKKKVKFFTKEKNSFYLNLTILPQYNDASNELEKFIFIGFDLTSQELEKQQTMQRVRKNIIEQRTKESELQKSLQKLSSENTLLQKKLASNTDVQILMEKLSKEKTKSSNLFNQVTYYEQQIKALQKEKEQIITKKPSRPAKEKTKQNNKDLQKLQAKVIEQQSKITKLENQLKNSKYV